MVEISIKAQHLVKYQHLLNFELELNKRFQMTITTHILPGTVQPPTITSSEVHFTSTPWL